MKRGLNINISFTNRVLYTFISVIILLIVGVGVFAFGTLTPSTFGHSAGELNLSAGVNGNAVFNGDTVFNNRVTVAGIIESTTGGIMFPDGTVQTTAAGPSGLWASSGSDVYYNNGNVGIGTSTPSESLDVVGNVNIVGNVNVNNIDVDNITISGTNFAVARYVNLGEDIYGDLVETTTADSMIDTCDGGITAAYTCLVNKEGTCNDVVDSAERRTVECYSNRVIATL